MSLVDLSVTGLGCHPATEDSRDCGLFIAARHFVSQPASIDYRGYLPGAWNQSNTSACTAYAITAAACFFRKFQGFGYFEPSKIWTYFFERKTEGTIGTDSGANIRDGMRSMVYDGLCPQWAWPDSQVLLFLDPEATYNNLRWIEPDKRFVDGYLLKEDPQWPAHHHKALGYRAVSLDPATIVAALVAGKVVVFGTQLYGSFWGTPSTGYVPLPTPGSETPVGGHALLIVGYFYNNGELYFIVRNSWGPGFGDGGYCYIDAAWFTPASGVPNWDGWTFTAMKA